MTKRHAQLFAVRIWPRRDYRCRTPQSPDQAIVPDPLIEIHKTEANEWEVAHGLDALSAEHRQAILLVYFDDLTSQEAADRLGVPVSTFNWWRRCALAEMKRALQDAEAAPA